MFRGKKQQDLDLSQLDESQFKCRICMLGTVLSGKSTIASGIVVTCETMSALIPEFYCYVLPTSTRILVDANNLRRGRFPKKTDPYAANPYESGLVIAERGGWRSKKVQVPLCDIAGEISDRIDPYNPGLDPLKERAQHINQYMIRRIRDSQGFIVALPANEALMLKDASSRIDADAYTYHVLSQIIEYKKRSRSPKLEHIYVVLTKWDEAKERASAYGMDVYEHQENGLFRFMVNGFPSLSMLLKPLNEQGIVSFYRSYFEIRKGEDGEKMLWPDKSAIINTFEDSQSDVRWRPEYAEQDYIQLVRDIGAMAK